jgi:hypothetical protein
VGGVGATCEGGRLGFRLTPLGVSVDIGLVELPRGLAPRLQRAQREAGGLRMFLKRDAMVMNAQGGLRSLRDSTGGVTLGDIGSTCTGTISTTHFSVGFCPSDSRHPPDDFFASYDPLEVLCGAVPHALEVLLERVSGVGSEDDLCSAFCAPWSGPPL